MRSQLMSDGQFFNFNKFKFPHQVALVSGDLIFDSLISFAMNVRDCLFKP